MSKWQDYLEVVNGEAFVKGTKLPAEAITDFIRSGCSLGLIKRSFPEIDRNHMAACMEYSIEKSKSSHGPSVSLPEGYKRIYHYHIRKCAGTSLNQSFLSLCGDGEELYVNLSDRKICRAEFEGRVFTAHSKQLIEFGNYFYAFSHLPSHTLRIPPRTFTITTFRDPLKRLLSHYKMLVKYREEGIEHPCMKDEGKWLGGSFSDFMRRMPREAMLNQLYMFSSTFNINEALERINRVSFYFFTEDFSEGLSQLGEKLGLQLKTRHEKKNDREVDVIDDELEEAGEKLAPEYELISRLKRSRFSLVN